MNRCLFVGKIVSDFETRGTEDSQVLRFRLAVRRSRGGSKEGPPPMDFIQCVAFNKTAGFIKQYFKRGDYIYICASYRSDEFTGQDGQKRRTHEFHVDEAGFCSPPPGADGNGGSKEQPVAPPPAEAPADTFELPF